MGEYYTYMLIDPRNSLPFYVGKGKGRRCTQHVHEARTSNKNSAKLNKIRKIERLGFEVEVKKVLVDVSDFDSQDFERLIIAECRDKGIELTNKTDGGDGSAGYKHTPESLAKMSAALSGKPKPESQKQKLSAYLKQNPIHARDGVTEKISGANHWAYGKPAKNLGSKWTDGQRAAQSERFSGERHNLFGKPCSDERRASIKAGTKGVKKSTTTNMRKPKQKIACIHCGLLSSGGNIARWHNDNCKEKQPC